MDMSKIAIVAALEREIRPLVRDWLVHETPYDGRTFRFFENAETVLVCSGIGAEAARRAAQAIIALYSPQLIYSVGFAGSATDTVRVGEVFIPRRVVNARDGSSVDTGTGQGVLVTFAGVASPEQKAKLGSSFGAHAVDMEASAVARAAEARGIRFAAVKAISDASDFTLPPMDTFIGPAGQFRTRKFAFFLLLRPWLWGAAMRLARNSTQASRALCTSLKQSIEAMSRQSVPIPRPSRMEAPTGR